MTATDVLRKEVKEYIDRADDKSLRIVKAILEIEQEDDDSLMDDENWDDLPVALRQQIEEGIKEADNGNAISYEEFKEKNGKWFKR